ncbi:hypothetical protein PVAND_008427 [Polypedilum vanderplanki]|uniref:GPR180/TMEM145 transmembrane domain-containing protein n=1 Tax=Polypedilum vanderplanki TaxID=319348 RepID=A0A9J6CA78_POLVA|nr:hypothetical protein PVAND_008427 [Polypedilum vanderplanki]
MNLIVLILFYQVVISKSLILDGSYVTSEFYKFVVKFGFIKTEKHQLTSKVTSDLSDFGYIYGNISGDDFPKDVTVTLAVLDRHHFLEFYGNRSVANRNLACRKMFARLNVTAYDSKCNRDGRGDYLRRVPCKNNGLCIDEDTPSNVVNESQFTYTISNQNQPRFWYISFVACYRNTTTCEWEHYNGIPRKINYHLELVNGHPIKDQNFYSPFIYHFSYDKQNILEQCLIFFTIYIFLVPIQIIGSSKQSHPVTKIFTMSIVMEFISIVFILVHLIKFASDGRGNEGLKIAGDIFDILSRTSFMLILLLLAKGWAVTRLEISAASWVALIFIWISYLVLNFVLYVWNMTEIDVISDIDEFQTVPGILVLISRSCIMLWFLYELRTTMKYEHSTKKLDFLLHFGASSLVWFIYLPIIALISMQVSVFWRYKLLLAVINSVDCLAYCVMMGLLWPNRSGQYLLLASPNTSAIDELDEFNEAPHNREIYHDHDDDEDNMQTLVVADDMLTNSSNHNNNVSDTLLLIENGDIPARNDSKGKVFT